MISILVITAGLVAAAFIIINQPKFGKIPSGARLERIQKSPHYKNGRFDNLNNTPQLAEDTSMPEVMFRFLFGKKDQLKPARRFTMKKTDLKALPTDENVFIWMGHSSYYMQMDGLKILVDPVFSGNASPFTFTTKAFEGSDLYTADDIPELDLLIITHGTISTIKRSGNFSTKHGEWPQALELRNILNIGDSIRRSLPNWIGLKMLSWEMDSAFTVSRQDIFPVVA